MDHSTNIVSFHLRIDKAVKSIMKDGKVDKNDIPEIVLLITELLGSTSTKLTSEEMANYINDMYNYIMTHYNLFPADDEQKASFKVLFDLCVKLALFEPNLQKIKNSVKSCFNCK